MATKTDYRFWAHETSGEIYAIRFGASADGVRGSDITGVCGPLHYSEREHPLDDFEYDVDDIEWVIDNSGAFRDVTTQDEYARLKHS